MPDSNRDKLVTVLGHTAAGKTAFAARLASKTGGEIISADSRQVYRGMDIGTGKDYSDYHVDGEQINVYLIDIADPGDEYNVHEFQKDFLKAYKIILSKGNIPVLCGGSGMYLEAVLKKYELINVPFNYKIRKDLAKNSMEELARILLTYRYLHNTTDIVSRKRLIRAIEIEAYKKSHPDTVTDFPDFNPIIFGIRFEREERRRRITERLISRLKNGMTEEVEKLLQSGITPAQLEYYGLEYKYLSWYLTGKINYDDMFNKLNTSIHQFAKRQMTWFRRMERDGVKIHWIRGEFSMDEKIKLSMDIINNYTP